MPKLDIGICQPTLAAGALNSDIRSSVFRDRFLPLVQHAVAVGKRLGLGLTGHSRLTSSTAGSLPKPATLPSARWARIATAIGPVAERQVLAGKGQKPQVGFRDDLARPGVTESGWEIDLKKPYELPQSNRATLPNMVGRELPRLRLESCSPKSHHVGNPQADRPAT